MPTFWIWIYGLPMQDHMIYIYAYLINAKYLGIAFYNFMTRNLTYA